MLNKYQLLRNRSFDIGINPQSNSFKLSEQISFIISKIIQYIFLCRLLIFMCDEIQNFFNKPKP